MENSRRNELRVEEILKERGMSKVQLAILMNTTKENLYGRLKSPSYPTLAAIANALEVPMYELFREDMKKSETYHSPFMAMVKDGSETYTAFSLPELERVVADIKGKGKKERNLAVDDNTQLR